jgi:23S rRNA (uridine2552-2'-O)-methyltransferase
MKKYRDHYFLKAKRENYPARSVYKLKEIAKRFPGMFKPGMRVLDLGAAPGSWSLGAAEMVEPGGSVLGADIQDTKVSFPANVTVMREDVFNRSAIFALELAARAPFHLVMSDMAPNTTGHRGTDQARSALLYEEALEVAKQYLAPGGSFIVKVFQGPDAHAYMKAMRACFATVRSFKPQSSRAESMETFYIGLGFRNLPPHDPGGGKGHSEQPDQGNE